MRVPYTSSTLNPDEFYSQTSESVEAPEIVAKGHQLQDVFQLEDIFYIRNKNNQKCKTLTPTDRLIAATAVYDALAWYGAEYLHANMFDAAALALFKPHYLAKVVEMAALQHNAERGIHALAYDFMKGLIMEYAVNFVFETREPIGHFEARSTPVDTTLYSRKNGQPVDIDVKYIPGKLLEKAATKDGNYRGWIPAGKLSIYRRPDGAFVRITDGEEDINSDTQKVADYTAAARQKMQAQGVLLTCIYRGRNVFYGVAYQRDYRQYALVTKFPGLTKFSRTIVLNQKYFIHDLDRRFVVREGKEAEAASRIQDFSK
jgi:hypothetical protein